MPTTPTDRAPIPYRPPSTYTRTSHAVTITTERGETIGLIFGWNPQMSRQITPIYEINAESSGVPIENVPGNVQNLTISINRYDIWTNRMEEAFGTRSLIMLSHQDKPFKVKELWEYRDINGGLQREEWLYHGCWFTNIGRNLRSDDNRIVSVNASLSYVWRELTEGVKVE